MHPKCTLGEGGGARGLLAGLGLGVVDEFGPRVGDGGVRIELWRVLELVHHVPIRAESETCVVAELSGDVDHRSALVKKQRGERMAEVVWARVLDAGSVE